MSRVLRLAAAFMREHPARLVLTSIATAAATCMVVWTASGYDALIRTFDEYANKTLGRFVLSVGPIASAADVAVPADVAAQLRADPAVAAAEPMWIQRVPVRSAQTMDEMTMATDRPPGDGPGMGRGGPGGMGGRPGMGGGGMGRMGGMGRGPGRPMQDPVWIATVSAEPPFELLRGRWIDPASGDAQEIVTTAAAAERLGVDLGDDIAVGKGEQTTSLRVVGIVDAPAMAGSAGSAAAGQILAPGAGEFFWATPLAEQVLGRSAIISFVGVALAPGTDLTAFRFGWAPRLGSFAEPVQFQEAHDIEEALDDSASADNVRLQAYAATGVALLVALLVIFSTVNMGVTERARQLAILRAVALTRAQVGGLVAIESLTLAAIGFAGGLAAGQGMLALVARRSAAILHHGAGIGGQALRLAAVAAFGGALCALIAPLYRAVHVKPLDAMGPHPDEGAGNSFSWRTLWVAAALIAVNPLLTFVFPPAFGRGILVRAVVGFMATAAGIVLAAPAVVAFVDRGVGPWLARLLWLDRRLLASQITTHVWRTVGAAVSMAVGLGLYVAVQVWGYTMLDAFVPGPWAPDAVLSFQPDGIEPERAAAVANLPGVDPARCVPIVVEQPRLLEDLTHSAERASVTRQDNVVIVGLDPARALGGARPLFNFEWAAGSPESAVAAMQQGHACVVPDHFLRETGLKVGDSFSLVPPDDSEHPASYVIAGAVKLPGWHWQTKQTGFRTRTHRAAALVFADYASVAADFNLSAVKHVWLSYSAKDADPQRIAADAQALYRDALGREVALGRNPDDAPYVQIMPAETIRRMTRDSAKRWLWVIGQIPLVALGISCIGVLNVMLASVRARRWDFGVLRAIGFTRGALVRAILAEGLLIGAVAGLLSLGFGILAGWCGCGIAQYASFFGGMNPALVVPVGPVLRGMLALAVLMLFTAIGPAAAMGRTKPLSLLQPGRGTF